MTERNDPFERLTALQKFGCGLIVMGTIMAWIVGRIVILANGSPVSRVELGQTHAIQLGRFEPRHTVYLDTTHLVISWVLQAPLYLFVAMCAGYTVYFIGRRISGNRK